MMEIYLRMAGIGVCALVLFACVCRIDLMRSGRSRASWFLVYLCFAMYALGVLLDLAVSRPVDWYEGAGIGGLMLFMVLTRKSWHGEPAPETNSAELRRADGTRYP
jgi:hypothetical protein